jgi:demethylmenaquinone methyltransferase/2-methoxy-6-polyprenyl-1,4-benzoquinol methylase
MGDKRRKAVVEQFDRDSGEYLIKNVRPEIVRERQRILNLVDGGTTYHRALDLGCGPGTMSEDCLGIADEVWGVDGSERMISIAAARAKDLQISDKVHFEMGNAEKLRFDNDYFDIVFCIGVLRYLDSWEEGLREIYRVLKPTGVIVATFYYRFSIQWFSMCLLRPLVPVIGLVKRRSLTKSLIECKAESLPFSYRRFKKVFYEAGFTNMKCQHSGFECYPFRRVFPIASRYLYLKMEAAWFDSNMCGWLGSICIVSGVKGGSSSTCA